MHLADAAVWSRVLAALPLEGACAARRVCRASLEAWQGRRLAVLRTLQAKARAPCEAGGGGESTLALTVLPWMHGRCTIEYLLQAPQGPPQGQQERELGALLALRLQVRGAPPGSPDQGAADLDAVLTRVEGWPDLVQRVHHVHICDFSEGATSGPVTDQHVLRACGWPAVTCLTLEGCKAVSDAPFADLVRLTTLHVMRCPSVTGAFASALLAEGALRRLGIVTGPEQDCPFVAELGRREGAVQLWRAALRAGAVRLAVYERYRFNVVNAVPIALRIWGAEPP